MGVVGRYRDDGGDRRARFFSLARLERAALRVEVEGDGTVVVWVVHDGDARATPVVVPAWLWRAYARRKQRR